jgi:hypothetical protein
MTRQHRRQGTTIPTHNGVRQYHHMPLDGSATVSCFAIRWQYYSRLECIWRKWPATWWNLEQMA